MGTPWKPSHRVQANPCGLRPRIRLGCEQTVLAGLTLQETTSSVEDWISKGDSFSFQCLVWQHTRRRLLPLILRHFLIIKNLHLSPSYVALSSYQPLPDKYLGQKGQLGPQETATRKSRWSICGLEISRWGHTRSAPPMELFLWTFASAKKWPRLFDQLFLSQGNDVLIGSCSPPRDLSGWSALTGSWWADPFGYTLSRRHRRDLGYQHQRQQKEAIWRPLTSRKSMVLCLVAK